MWAKQDARTAAEAMSWPVFTIGSTARIDVAAATMLDRDVNRLPVVDGEGVLTGIITRADLVRAFLHGDDEIAKRFVRACSSVSCGSIRISSSFA